MSLGIYISVPFCRSKCTYCNFASGVFSAAQMNGYVNRLCADMISSRSTAQRIGALVPGPVDTIFMGGGTPSLLPPEMLAQLFAAIRTEFTVAPMAEITVECAPGTLTEAIIQTLVACGANRISLGVQSFVDREAASVGRLHTREKTLADIAGLRRAGISNINIDLIAGLPHQTPDSWNYSVEQAVETGVPHVSVYMLEVDDDSRLGREVIAGGTKYHAHSVPDDDATAEFYEQACDILAKAGICQYEISNFARLGFESLHNLKYWTRRPYLGFGVDAHSMLPAGGPLRQSGIDCLRLATTDSYEDFLKEPGSRVTSISADQALEESFFLGLRLNRGVDTDEMAREFGEKLQEHRPVIEELLADGLLHSIGRSLQLTPRGRLLSNNVFEKFILTSAAAGREVPV